MSWKILAAIALLLLPLIAGSSPQSQSQELGRRRVVIKANETVTSNNGTFELGFFSPDSGNSYFLGIWYASVSPPTYIWVANRETPVRSLESAALEITESGELAIRDGSSAVAWRSENSDFDSEPSLVFFETGNLALVSPSGSITWQSFDFPADTWLPGMNLTAAKGLRSWRSGSDPSPGLYSLRMRPGFGEFELVFNATEPYWRTGNWTGESFSNVPEMMVPYIYKFRFDRAFEAEASFGFSERALDNGLEIPLTRFRVDPTGLFRQFTWSAQTESWNMFWFQPVGTCRIFGTCGEFGLCGGERACSCPSGFEPVNAEIWGSGDFSEGCRRLRESDEKGVVCGESDDGFEEVGVVGFGESGKGASFGASLGDCKRACLESCACVGVYHNQSTNLCRKVSGSLLNLRNLSSGSESGVGVVYVRVPKSGVLEEEKKKKKRDLSPVVLAASIVGCFAVLGFLVLALLFVLRRRRKKEVEEEGVFPVLTLKVFSYKELHQVTGGFSEKLGHGGFGAVFRGKLNDSVLVAVKRLERPGSGEKEFRAEVCTIGNIQHVNLVRLRGFCSEDSQRLLVYDYMPNGALSHYLRKGGPNLSWDVRFRVAIGTGRGIAYLHEECRDCIIHCDIKPENILLDGDFTPKVSDFGLAKFLGRDFSRVLATMRGTWGYVAPEWISGVAITTKADVYSYGMTLIELIGGRRNVEARPSGGGGNGVGEKWFFPPWAARQIIEGNVAAVIDHRLGNAYDAEEARRVGLVAVWCIQDDEAIRPTMGTVVKMLEGVVEVAVPPVPKLLQALVSGESFRGVKADSGVLSPENQGMSNNGLESFEGNVDVSETQESSLSFVDKR